MVTIDYNKGVVYQVRNLTPQEYEEWVHKREEGLITLRMFDSDFWEKLSRTPWYFVPVVWLPIISYFFFFHFSHTLMIHRVLLFLIGAMCWIPTEYFVHRFLFHYKPTTPFMQSTLFMWHGIHHKTPKDPDRLVMPLFISVCGALLLIPSISYIFGVSAGMLLLTGFGSMYIWYDVYHYSLHHTNKDVINMVSDYVSPTLAEFFKRTKMKHAAHHYSRTDEIFGVTSQLMDLLFGTI